MQIYLKKNNFQRNSKPRPCQIFPTWCKWTDPKLRDHLILHTETDAYFNMYILIFQGKMTQGRALEQEIKQITYFSGHPVFNWTEDEKKKNMKQHFRKQAAFHNMHIVFTESLFLPVTFCTKSMTSQISPHPIHYSDRLKVIKLNESQIIFKSYYIIFIFIIFIFIILYYL